MSTYVSTTIVLVAMVAAFVISSLLLKSPDISLAIAATVAVCFGCGFGWTDSLPRVLVEGLFVNLDIALLFIAASIFVNIYSKTGAIDVVTRKIVSRVSNKWILLAIMGVMMIIPGALTGAGSISIFVLGSMVTTVVSAMGLSKKKTAAFVFMFAIMSAAAPPVNLWAMMIASGCDIPYVGFDVPLLAPLAGLCCKLPKVLSVVSRLALTAALAVGLCLNGGYLRGVVRTHHAENLAAYQFFVRTIEAGLADAVQSDDLILCNENVWDSNAEAESAFFSRFTGRALHAQVLWTENPATDGDAYAYQTYRNYGGYDLAWCGRLQSADSDLMDGVQVYVQSAYVPDNAVIKYKVRLADGTEEARAICLLDCTQTPRDRNGDYLATVEDTSIVNAKLMIWDG